MKHIPRDARPREKLLALGPAALADVGAVHRHLEEQVAQQDKALLVVADTKATFLLSGTGDVIEPDEGICAIGSGGTAAVSAARALARNTKLGPKEIATEAMKIASEVCIYTNANFTIEEL